MNIFLEKMGYSEKDKVLITHIDDIGFCHGSNVAAFACLDAGAASCGSVIVNAPWFLETAAICRDNPHYDMGVHLTLTCEYDHYRWPPLSSVDHSTGLLDHEGCLWRTSREAVKNVTEAAAEAEMRAQIEKALAHGIDVTHIDTHMGTVVHPKFIVSYLKLAEEFAVPAFLPNITRERIVELQGPEFADQYADILAKVDAGKVPTLDEIITQTLIEVDDKFKFYCQLIDALKPGLTHLLFHAAKKGEELRAITADSCDARNQDYEVFSSPGMQEFIDQSGAKLIGYRTLREYLTRV
jgi:hypothetical protein